MHLLGRLPSSLAELEAMFRRLLVGMAAFARSGGDTCLEAMSALALRSKIFKRENIGVS